MAYSMNGEEKLARELASRGVSRFTDVSDGPAIHWLIILFAAGVFFLLFHVAVFSKIYAVQLSRFTGNYAETEATVVSLSSETEYIQHTKREHHRRHGDTHTVSAKEVTTYSIKAVGDDGTEFSFRDNTSYGGKGGKLRIKYSKSNPRNYYVATALSYMSPDSYFGLILLVFAMLVFAGAYAVFRRNRKGLTALASGSYLPVLETSYCEQRTVHRRGHSHSRGNRSGSGTQYAPVFRYAMPDGAVLLFQGMWTCERPYGEAANEVYEYRVYMMDPEDRSNNEYFIKEVRRRV